MTKILLQDSVTEKLLFQRRGHDRPDLIYTLLHHFKKKKKKIQLSPTSHFSSAPILTDIQLQDSVTEKLLFQRGATTGRTSFTLFSTISNDFFFLINIF